MSTQSKSAFLKWLRVNNPKLYEDAMARAGGQMGALSDTISKVFDSVTNFVSKAGTAYVQGRAALELTKANIKRAKAGLAPVNSLDEANYPAEDQSQGFGGIPQWAIYAGLGLIAFMLFRR